MNKELSRYISKLVKVDQEIRNLRMNDPNLLGNLHGYIVYLIDGVHNWRLHKIVEEYGYPTQKLIGKRGMRDFWLLVQHQDFDVEFQKMCLKHCDFELREQAYLTDRILINTDKKQLYGTQFFKNEKGEYLGGTKWFLESPRLMCYTKLIVLEPNENILYKKKVEDMEIIPGCHEIPVLDLEQREPEYYDQIGKVVS